MVCKNCGSSNFRLSRWRVGDVWHFMYLHFPVRCRKCLARGFTNIFDAQKIWQKDKIRHAERRHKAHEANR